MGKIYLLSNKKYNEVENLEVFKIKFVKPLIDIQNFDALVFTSKNSIYSLQHFKIKWKNIPSYAISKQTASIIKEEGGNLVFTGKSSHGDEFAQELTPLLKDKKVLYVKALRTVSNLTNILKAHKINIFETTAYETICNDDLNTTFEKDSVFIFTSPSSIECFFKKYNWDDSFKAVCIGKTTKKFLPEYITNYVVSPITSIDECIRLAKNTST